MHQKMSGDCSSSNTKKDPKKQDQDKTAATQLKSNHPNIQSIANPIRKEGKRKGKSKERKRQN